MNQSIKLLTTSILQVPLEVFEKNFTFIVNGVEYPTSTLIAQLLSPKISKILLTDPTINQITINTVHRGDFQLFLDLLNFNSKDITSNDLNFIGEIVEQLEIVQFDIKIVREEITVENVLSFLSNDENFKYFYSQQYQDEIDFVSKNFSEIERNQRSSLLHLSFDTLEAIVNNPKLEIENEDQLLNFINELYSISNEYSTLYEYVYFEYVETHAIEEFLASFDIDDITSSIWTSISRRLRNPLNGPKINENDQKRYKNKIINFCHESKLDGIFQYFRTNSNIQEEVTITSSSVRNGDLQKVVQSDDPENAFYTENAPDQWVCFEFLKTNIIPTKYTIRSDKWKPGEDHLRNWVIEGSDDKTNWEIIDNKNECAFLNGYCYTHTFHISNDDHKKYKCLRIRQTGITWENTNYLCFNAIEFFGEIVQIS